MRHLALVLALGLTLSACRSTGADMRPRILEPATPGAGPRVTDAVPPTAPDAPADGRLPGDVTPRAYALGLTLDPRREGFEGEVEIAINLAQTRDVIWMHGLGLEILEARVEREGREPMAARWEPSGDEGLAALRLPEALGPGEARLVIRYSASFTDGLRGLYRVRVGEDSYAFTQLQSVFARRAFPCFDEPGLKARFRLTLRVPEADRAFTNTPLESEAPAAEGWKTLVFAPSPPMPTYLLAIATGPLDLVEAEAVPPNDVRDAPLPLRGIAARGHGPELAHALAETGPILAELERYFGTPYPYAKLDIVAVPDFAAGAMENAGLVTFRESLLLIREPAPERQLRVFANVMAHELSHMWFGNLVTMRWWDDLWLNEAFATWRASETVAVLYPDHHAELAAGMDARHAMGADSLISARRIREPIESDDDIENAFDAITYSKGSAVIAMFEAWVGGDAFREGVRRYLQARRWGNASTSDFLEALSGAARRDVATPMRTFLDQPGLPFVDVRTVCEGRRARLELRQSRYLPAGSTGETSESWQLPFCARFSAGGEVKEACTLLTTVEGRLELPTRVCPDWVLPNVDGLGYYRFGLEPSWLAKLGPDVFEGLADREQLSLADSLSAAFANGRLPAASYYGELPSLSRSSVRPVATGPMSSLRRAADTLVGPDLVPAVRAYGFRLYGSAYARLGWDAGPDDDGERRLMRASVVRFMADFVEAPAAREEARQRARRYLGVAAAPELGALEPELVGLALKVAAQESDAAFFDLLLSRFEAAADPLERARLLRALSSVRDADLSQRALDLSLDPRLRRAETMVPLWVQLRMPETRGQAWIWLGEHLEALAERLGPRAGDLPLLGRFFCDQEGAERVEALFAPHLDSWRGSRRELALTRESIDLCVALVTVQGESARAYFRENQVPAPLDPPAPPPSTPGGHSATKRP